MTWWCYSWVGIFFSTSNVILSVWKYSIWIVYVKFNDLLKIFLCLILCHGFIVGFRFWIKNSGYFILPIAPGSSLDFLCLAVLSISYFIYFLLWVFIDFIDLSCWSGPVDFGFVAASSITSRASRWLFFCIIVEPTLVYFKYTACSS